MSDRHSLFSGALVCCILFAAISPGAVAREVEACGRARVGHAEALCFPGARFTVEAWIRARPGSPGKWMRILSKYGTGPGPGEDLAARGWEVAITDKDALFFRVVPRSEDGKAAWVGMESVGRVARDRWTHVACVLDGPGGELRLYLDGKLSGQRRVNVAALQVNPSQDLSIGGYGGADIHLFDGLIDEIRLVADALAFDGPPVAPYSGEEPGTVALYHLDEQGAGGVLRDAAGDGGHRAALIDGDLPALADSRPGFGRALRVTGEREPGVEFHPRALVALPHPSLEEIERVGARWAERWPDRFRAGVEGRAGGGLPVIRWTITDVGVPDDDKESVLMTAMHSGSEVSGSNALIAFAEWLAGDDPGAARIRVRQVCTIVPVPNPSGYGRTTFNASRRDPAWCWSAGGATFREENPEGALIQGLIDRLAPDLLVDSHGTWFDGQTMGEFVGTSGFSLILNTYQGSVVREMGRAADALGFPQHLGSESHEKILAAESVSGAPHAFFIYPGGAAINAPIYSYIRHHSLAMAMESGGWTGSAVARLRRLLEIGCERWPTEPVAGYPNRRITSSTAWMQCLAAWGPSASRRRASRVELWRKQGQLVRFASYPDMDRAFLYGVATSPAAAGRLLRGSRRGQAGVSVARFLANLGGFDGVDPAPIRACLEGMGATGMRSDPLPDPGVDASPIRCGLALRGVIPYAGPSIRGVRLNGRVLASSGTDGYQTWRSVGGTFVQVNIPPERVGEVAIVTCEYEPGEPREWGWSDREKGAHR